MRLHFSALVVLLAASVATATIIVATPTRKGDAVSCNAPIGSISCRVQPNGYLQGFSYGAWPAPPAGYTPAPQFIQGEGDYWYTNGHWCEAFGKLGRCMPGAAASSDIDITFPAATGASPATGVTLSFLQGFTVCYGAKKGVKGITWNLQEYTVQYTASVGNPPIPTWTTAAVTSTDTCGIVDNCAATATFTADQGKVIGGIFTKCKYSQGWFKYVQNGQYKSLYTLEKIDKVCTTTPKFYPQGKFIPCDSPDCADPNSAACPDSETYVCPACDK